MICNGTQAHISVVFFLIIVLLHASSCQQQQKQKQQKQQKENDEDKISLLGTNGDLYEVFKKRLEKFNSEMSLNKEGLFDDKPSKTNIAEEKRSTVRECLYEEYKKRLDKINNELSLDGEKVFDRSGRNTEKENNVNSGANGENKKIEEGSRVLLQSSLAHVKPLNNAIKKSVGSDIQEMSIFEEMNEKSQHKSSERKAFIKNYDLRKLQPAVHASEEMTTVDKNSDNKVHTYSGESLEKEGKTANLAMPTLHSDKEIIKLPINSEENLKDSSKRRRHAESSYEKSQTELNMRDMSAQLIPSDLSPSYPSVLTKGLNTEILSGTRVAPSTLLNSVASKLKTSPLDLAKKLATATDGSANIKNDPKLTKLLQKYIENSINLNSNGRTAKDTADTAALTESLCMPQDLPHYQIAALPQGNQLAPPQAQPQPQPQPQAPCQVPGPVQTLEYNSVSNILEKVLTKLEQIQECKPDSLSDKFCEVEGAPCEILGTWNSYIMGLRFGIKTSSGSAKKRLDHKSESENLVLTIDVQETNPPKLHQIMDTGWKFTGSAMKQIGGPFFIISETKAQNVLATFAGYCRTCGSIDTIFGSWTFVFPSKDCQDISVAIENKRDIFRRDLLDAKIGERYNSVTCDKVKKPPCSKKKM